MSSLRDHLLDAYGGYADKRIKNRSLDRPIKIDDGSPRDVYPHHCSIFVRVPDRTGETLTLTLQHCPHSPDLIALVNKHGGTATISEHGCDIRLNLNANQISTVTSLAIAVSKVTKRGNRYPNPNWKWIGPRTAGSLRRLAKVLKEYKVHRSQKTPRPSMEDPGSPIARR